MEIKINITDEKNTIRETIQQEINKMLKQNYNKLSNDVLIECLKKRTDKYISKCEKDGHFYHVLANNLADKLDTKLIIDKFDINALQEAVIKRVSDELLNRLGK